MNFATIKQNLYKAGRLVDEGKVSEADVLIRSMLGKGLTPNDITNILTKDQLSKLKGKN